MKSNTHTFCTQLMVNFVFTPQCLTICIVHEAHLDLAEISQAKQNSNSE